MQFTIRKEHLEEVENFIQNEKFIRYMNKEGLSVNAMVLIVQLLNDGIKLIKEKEEI